MTKSTNTHQYEQTEEGFLHHPLLYCRAHRTLDPTTMTFATLLRHMELTQQSALHHPEGNVFIHTALTHYDVGFRTNFKNMEIRAAALFHDTGKVLTTRDHGGGKVTAYGHETESLKFAKQFVPVFYPDANHELVYYIIENHMRIKLIDRMRPVKVRALQEAGNAISSQAYYLLTVFGQADNGIYQNTRYNKDEKNHIVEAFRRYVNIALLREEKVDAVKQKLQTKKEKS
jgi:hypothetical protein